MLVATDDLQAVSRADLPPCVAPVPVFVINLERDAPRRAMMKEQLSALEGFDARFVRASNGLSLPAAVCNLLAQDAGWAKHKGTIGCFLSHVQAWEGVAGLDEPYAIVVEDDVDCRKLGELLPFELPEDAGLVFLNDRMSPNLRGPSRPEILPLWHALKHLDTLRSGGPGGDGYLLTPGAAQTMLEACTRDLFFGHVDGRLLRYGASETDLAMLEPGSWIADVIRRHHHPALVPPLGLVRGYCLSRPVVTHKGLPSTREALDRKETAVAGTAARPAPEIPGERLPPGQCEMIAVRYWNRISNIGDLINPQIIEAVSGRRPFYQPDDSQDHVLGIGSIFFMANEHSHIWGSGMLDPSGDYGVVRHQNVHAVRGKLTRDVLHRRYGFVADVALGDPGIFVDELPQVASFLPTARPRRRVGLIPHYAMASHPDILRLAAELDADILNPRTSSLDFLRDVAESEIIVSQSLHGLIFAETLGKPSVWIAHDQGELWAFKFHDWFSNTFEPPESPLPLSVNGKIALGHARLSGLLVDRAALRSAFPVLPPATRRPGIAYGISRARPPYTVLIASNDREPSDSAYDATFPCPRGDPMALRVALNQFSRLFDDAVCCFLVFDPELFVDLSMSDRTRMTEALTDRPGLHYVGMLRAPGDAEPRILAAPWQNEHSWRGVVLIRNLINFSFDAPGLAFFKP